MTVNLNNLNKGELYKLRIHFDDEKDVKKFAEMVVEDLQVRIGEEISIGKTEDQLYEFDMCETTAQATKWLQKYCPEYRKIVERNLEEMETELFVNRYHILGARVIDELCEKDDGIDALYYLGEEALRWLTAEGITTVGELAKKDFSTVEIPSTKLMKNVINALDEYRLFNHLGLSDDDFDDCILE